MIQTNKTALIMAGGTGGHIFPGLAVAQALEKNGWKIHWLGVPASMEARLVPPYGFEFEALQFGGVRGKGLRVKLSAPLKLASAIKRARKIIKDVQPDVALGFGGYITMPGGIAARLSKVPVLLHEQNSIAGLSNRVLAKIAKQTFTAFPNVFVGSQVIGNPLREQFMQQKPPAQRFAERQGPLRLLVVGGSLGAQALNTIVPQALALMAPEHRMHVLHQSGQAQIKALKDNYANAQVDAELTPFIDNMAEVYAQADLVLCRAGASTVTEISAVGAAACFVPFPYAVDDHQTANAKFLSDLGAAWLLPQSELTAPKLAEFLTQMTRQELLSRAQKAHALAQLQATEQIVSACERVIHEKQN